MYAINQILDFLLVNEQRYKITQPTINNRSRTYLYLKANNIRVESTDIRIVITVKTLDWVYININYYEGINAITIRKCCYYLK